MVQYLSRRQSLSPHLQCMLVLLELILYLVKLQAALILLNVLGCVHEHHVTGRNNQLLFIQSFKSDGSKFGDELVFKEKGADVCEIDVAQDTSKDLS